MSGRPPKTNGAEQSLTVGVQNQVVGVQNLIVVVQNLMVGTQNCKVPYKPNNQPAKKRTACT